MEAKDPNKMNMKVEIAGAVYTVGVPFSESGVAEKTISESAKMINTSVAEFEQNYGAMDKKDVLALVCLGVAKELRVHKKAIQLSLAKLKTLEQLVDNELKNINNY